MDDDMFEGFDASNLAESRKNLSNMVSILQKNKYLLFDHDLADDQYGTETGIRDDNLKPVKYLLLFICCILS